jgi:hypothetical protein
LASKQAPHEIGFEQMQRGLREMDVCPYFNRDHWDTLVEGFLQGGKDTLDLAAFSKMIQVLLREYVLRALSRPPGNWDGRYRLSSEQAKKIAIKMLLLEVKGGIDDNAAHVSADANSRLIARLQTKIEQLLAAAGASKKPPAETRGSARWKSVFAHPMALRRSLAEGALGKVASKPEPDAPQAQGEERLPSVHKRSHLQVEVDEEE